MRSIATTIAAAALLAGLAGCASTGNVQLKDATHESIDKQIVAHQTTRDQVRAAFGDPNRVAYSQDHRETWAYVFAHATPTASSFIPVVGMFSHGSDVDTKQLLVEFDDQGVVSKYTYSDSKSQTRGGILE